MDKDTTECKYQPLLLMPTDDEAEVWAKCVHFRTLEEDEQRFTLAWFRELEKQGEVPSVEEVAKRAGFGRSKGYDLWGKRDKCMVTALREVAQILGGKADAIASMAYDMLCLDAYRRVADGSLNAVTLTPTTLRLLSDAKARLVPGARAVVATDERGRTVSGISAEGDDAATIVADVLKGLRPGGGAERTAPAAGEHESAETVRQGAVRCNPSSIDQGCAVPGDDSQAAIDVPGEDSQAAVDVPDCELRAGTEVPGDDLEAPGSDDRRIPNPITEAI